MTYFWAFLAGVLTLINPCVLPLLPVIIAGALQSHRFGPVMMALGLTVSFTVVGVLVTAFGHLIGLDEIMINRVAATIMIIFGIVLLLPRAQEKLSNIVAPLASGANARIDSTESSGLGSQFFIGVLLGAVWSPCVGPTLGGAIGLAASGSGLGQATIIMLCFGLGVSVDVILVQRIIFLPGQKGLPRAVKHNEIFRAANLRHRIIRRFYCCLLYTSPSPRD